MCNLMWLCSRCLRWFYKFWRRSRAHLWIRALSIQALARLLIRMLCKNHGPLLIPAGQEGTQCWIHIICSPQVSIAVRSRLETSIIEPIHLPDRTQNYSNWMDYKIIAVNTRSAVNSRLRRFKTKKTVHQLSSDLKYQDNQHGATAPSTGSSFKCKEKNNAWRMGVVFGLMVTLDSELPHASYQGIQRCSYQNL